MYQQCFTTFHPILFLEIECSTSRSWRGPSTTQPGAKTDMGLRAVRRCKRYSVRCDRNS